VGAIPGDDYPTDVRWGSTTDRGVYVSVKDKDHPPSQAAALLACLTTAKIGAAYSNYAGAPANMVMLAIAPP
jgi:hypothetical protein